MIITARIPSLAAAVLLSAAAARAADNFASATVLTGPVATSTESNASATNEPGEPAFAVKTLWWTWTAPASGRASVETTGSAVFDKYLVVFVPKSDPPAVNALSTITDQHAFRPQFPVAAGTKYYFGAGSRLSSQTGNIKVTVLLDTDTDINQINLQGQALVANDFFAKKAVLTGPRASSISYNTSATNEPASQEPQNGSRTTWWTWTAPDSGMATFSAQGSDDFDQALCLFQGNSLSTLRWIDAVQTSRPGLAIPVTAGTAYQISLGSRLPGQGGSQVMSVNLDMASGIHQLPLGPQATTANDAFADRTVLTGSYVSAIGYGSYAGREALEPEAAGFGTLWWSWTAPAPGQVTLSTEGTDDNYDKYLTVWTGGAVSALTQTARSNASGKPGVTFIAAAGQTYHFSVGARLSSQTARTVVLTLNAPGKEAAGLQIAPAVRLSWLSVAGRNYRIESSADLKTWSPTDRTFVGDGTVLESFHSVKPGAAFFRVAE